MDIVSISNFKANNNKRVAFPIPRLINNEGNITLDISIKTNGNLPSYEWRYNDKIIELPFFIWYYIIWILSLLILLIAIFYFKRYRNSLILQIKNNPKALLTLKPNLLAEAKKRLSTIDELKTILKSIGIDQEQLDLAIRNRTLSR